MTHIAQLAVRMREAGVRGRSVTLKLKRRKADAGQPLKFLGHGACDNLSRCITLSRYTAAAGELARYGRDLLRALHVPPQDIRGIGLSVRCCVTFACKGSILWFQVGEFYPVVLRAEGCKVTEIIFIA